MEINEAIKKGLEDRRVTQRDLAKVLKVTQATISQWVTGKVNPSWEMAKKIIDYLDLVPLIWPEFVKSDEVILKKWEKVNWESKSDTMELVNNYKELVPIAEKTANNLIEKTTRWEKIIEDLVDRHKEISRKKEGN